MFTDIEELEELYDLTPEPSEDVLPPLNEDLTKEEIEEAPFFNQLKRGVMLVTGEPGSGKGTFTHFLLWKLRTLFKGFKVMLDKKPRMLFGSYIPINTDIILNEFKNLDEQYKTGKRSIKHDFAKFSQHKDKVNAVVESWLGNNKELFYNAGLGLDEFWVYFNNREPHNPMNKILHPLFKRYRHHELLILGITPHADELDTKRCLKYVTHEIRCSQTTTEGIHLATIHKTRWFEGKQVLEVADTQRVMLFIDALKPRERLGGKCIYDMFNSWERGEIAPRIKIKA